MITYIKGQQAKGFTREEIRDNLVNAGWNKAIVDKHLKEEVLASTFGKQSTEEIEAFAAYAKYLLQDETIESAYHIGLFTLVITNKRLLVLEKYPRNITEYYFNDLELVEYRTTISWIRGGYSLLYMLGFGFFWIFHTKIWEKIVALVPASATFFNIRPILDFDIGTLIILAYLLVYFFIDITAFVLSFVGRLSILPKDLGPKELLTRYNASVEEFLSQIEPKLEKQHEERKIGLAE